MVTPLKVEFQFDFGSPNACLAELALAGIERRTGAKFEYVPVLLGGIYKATNNMSPAESLRGIRNKPEYQALETQRFIRRHNITKFHHNPLFPVNTLMLMRGAVAAQFEGVFEPYFRAAYHHMWEEPKKMDDLEVFRSAFISSGIDIEKLMTRAQQDEVKKKLIEVTTDAVNRGAFGSPTFFVGGEMFFGKDQLRDVEESIVEQTSHVVANTA
jgi:2-hydroxychromene-2-carboxylate isomerase